jgi:two-component system, OmpR family, sensor kinase
VSAGGRPAPGRLLRPARWTMRARLLAVIVTLLAVVCVVVGTVVTLALQRFLVERLDAQVAASTGRAFGARSYPGPDDDGNPPGPPIGRAQREALGFLQAPGQAVGTVGARIENGVVTAAGVLVATTSRPDVEGLTSTQAAVLASLPTDGTPQTRTIDGLGTYRLAAHSDDDGDVVVAGLPMAPVTDTVAQLVLVEVLVAGSGLAVAAVVGTVIVRRSLAPLDRVAATARRVSTLPLAEGEVSLRERVPEQDADPGTEVGQVAIALNRMLGHVDGALAARHASETRVRQFVADASHELRTPLASIRGYAEFAQLRAGPLPPDAANALVRVRSQTERMADLVDDLLLLARLDSGRPLARDDVDLSRLLVDAVSDAHAAGPDHSWLLDVPDEPVTVTGDAARLHQVLANLLANARTHTPPGTRVTTALAAEPRDAVVTVSDDGPGITAALLPDVFDRFARGDDSRTRGAGSTGLGLAIVSAVVTAHGGTVAVSSEPGATTFTVRLPLTESAQDDHTAGIPEPSSVDA